MMIFQSIVTKLWIIAEVVVRDAKIVVRFNEIELRLK